MDCKIKGLENNQKTIREISIDFGGFNYYVIYGEYANGGFFAIPNWNVGGNLSEQFDDTFYNSDKIYTAFKNSKDASPDIEAAAKVIAKAIKEYEKILSKDDEEC